MLKVSSLTGVARVAAGGLAALCLSAGCSREAGEPKKQTGAAGASAVSALAGLAPDEVLVDVNGETMTKRQYEEEVQRIVRRVSAMSNIKPAQAAAVGKMAVQMALPRFVSTRLMLAEARRTGVLSEEALKARSEEALTQVARRAKVPVEDFLKKLPEGESAFRKELEESVLVSALLATNVISKISVSDAYVAAAQAAIQEESRAIESTNAVKIARLRAVREQLLAGREFGPLADEVSECQRSGPGNHGYWGLFERSDLPDRAMRTAVFALKPGEVSDVLEDEEGFHLVKLLDIVPAVKNAQGKVVEPESAKLAHILLRRAPRVEQTSPAELKRQLTEQVRQRGVDAYIEGLKTNAVIRYPHGTNFMARAKEVQ